MINNKKNIIINDFSGRFHILIDHQTIILIFYNVLLREGEKKVVDMSINLWIKTYWVADRGLNPPTPPPFTDMSAIISFLKKNWLNFLKFCYRLEMV